MPTKKIILFALLIYSFAANAVTEKFSLDLVREKIPFYGLAFYFNDAKVFLLDKDEIKTITEQEEFILEDKQWLALVGRFKVLLIQKNGIRFSQQNNEVIINNAELLQHQDAIVKEINKDELKNINVTLDKLRYSHLWWPLTQLAKGVEYSLLLIKNIFNFNWGICLFLFAIIMKLILFPLAKITKKQQQKVDEINTILQPKLAAIKKDYDGEEAHNRIMAAHKELNISPFYSLKPSLALFIQLPLLIAIFNALGEMPHFVGISFLWINDLAYPDAVLNLPLTIPFFGNSLNILPFVMTAITIWATFKEQKQAYRLYGMALIFFILFYPFPAVMVLYWSYANLCYLLQQKFL